MWNAMGRNKTSFPFLLDSAHSKDVFAEVPEPRKSLDPISGPALAVVAANRRCSFSPHPGQSPAQQILFQHRAMEALRAWRASSNLFGFTASRVGRPLRSHTRCCSAAAATAKSPSQPPQDRRRRSASSSSSTSDRESIRAIRLKKVSFPSAATCCAFTRTMLAWQFLVYATTDLLEPMGWLLGWGAQREGLRTIRLQVG